MVWSLDFYKYLLSVVVGKYLSLLFSRHSIMVSTLDTKLDSSVRWYFINEHIRKIFPLLSLRFISPNRTSSKVQFCVTSSLMDSGQIMQLNRQQCWSYWFFLFLFDKQATTLTILISPRNVIYMLKLMAICLLERLPPAASHMVLSLVHYSSLLYWQNYFLNSKLKGPHPLWWSTNIKYQRYSYSAIIQLLFR